MFKIKRNPEEERGASIILASSDVIKTLNCSTSSHMTLKRNPMSSVHFRMAPTFLPQSTEHKSNEQQTGDEFGESKNEHEQVKTRIFSISSNTLTPNKNVINFLASICLCGLFFIIIQGTEAQFSSRSSNQNGPYNNNQKQLPSEIRVMPYGNTQPGLQSIVTPSSLQSHSDGRYVSIDRFDSGEQIRPPLLAQPTTVAPAGKSQQVSSYQNGNFNLEASASDSYMTPEERDQLLRQQENHYEGRDSDKLSDQQSESPPQASNSRLAGSRKDGQESDDQPRPVVENRSLQSDETNNAAAGANDSDDSDYDQDEDPQQQHQKKETPGRAGNELGNKKQAPNSRAETRRTMHANDNGDESEPNDDFGGVNDDAYFSRQPNGASGSSSPSGLNRAASQHQSTGSSGESQYNRRINNHNSDQAGEGKQAIVDEAQGFGPGPNEAYLADQAESRGKAGLDWEDDNDISNVNSAEGEKLETRSSKGQSKLNPLVTEEGKTVVTSPHQDSFAGGDDDSDADESADSSEDSLVPSMSSPELGSNSQQTVPSESSSVVAPSVIAAASSIDNLRSTSNDTPTQIIPRTSPTKTTLPLFGIQRHPQQQQLAAATTKQYQASPHHQVHIGGNIQPQNSPGTKHQKSAFNAAYNPLNNPSHIGKFFIN